MADSGLPAGFALDDTAPAAAAPPAPPPQAQGAAGDPNADAPPAGFTLDEETYGTPSQEAQAGLEAVARGATLGTSDWMEQALGIAQAQPIRMRREENPTISLAGEAAGAALPLAATRGLAAPEEFGAVLGSAIQGGILGAGSAVSDVALGDPNLNAQKILADVGGGIAGGAAFGALEKGVGSYAALLRVASKAEPGAAETASRLGSELAPPTDGISPAPPEAGTPVLQPNAAPSSLETLRQQISDLKNYGGQEDIQELPQAQIAREAAANINPEMQLPFDEMQLGSLASQDARNSYKVDLAIPGDAGQVLRDREVIQKKNLSQILDNTIDDIAPNYTPTSDAQEAGARAAQALTDTLIPAREQLGAAIGELKGTTIDDMDHLPGVIDYLTDPNVSANANPKIANMFDTNGDEISFKPWDAQMGISSRGYTNIKRALTSIQNQNPSVEGLFDIRKSLEDGVNVLERGGAGSEMVNARAAMMSYIQDAVQSATPDVAVRDAFAAYAKNEDNIRFIEKSVGAQVGDDWRSLAANRPEENILGKIFRDSATTQRVKEVVPPEKFQQMLADHIAIQKNAATREGILSSAKFSNAINAEARRYALQEAFSDRPGLYQKLKDATTLLRIFPDSMPANPSGTTTTLLSALAKGGLDPLAHAHELFKYGKEKYAEFAQAKAINAKLAGQAATNGSLRMIQNITDRVGKQIDSAGRAVWGSPLPKAAAIESGIRISNALFDESTANVKRLSSNPDAMADHLSHSTVALSHSAPHITQGIQSTIARGVQFLAGKVPPSKSPYLLSSDYEPSDAEKQKFGRYLTAVNNPLSAMADVKKAQLSPETMEALQAVHPDLLQDMRRAVMQNFSAEKAKSLTPAQRAALSAFLGQPIDDTLTAQTAARNQAVFAQPNISQQSTPKPTRATLGGMKQLKAAERAGTRSEAEEP